MSSTLLLQPVRCFINHRVTRIGIGYTLRVSDFFNVYYGSIRIFGRQLSVVIFDVEGPLTCACSFDFVLATCFHINFATDGKFVICILIINENVIGCFFSSRNTTGYLSTFCKVYCMSRAGLMKNCCCKFPVALTVPEIFAMLVPPSCTIPCAPLPVVFMLPATVISLSLAAVPELLL